MNARAGRPRPGDWRKRSRDDDKPDSALKGTGVTADSTYNWGVQELKDMSICPEGNVVPEPTRHVAVDLNRQHRREHGEPSRDLQGLRAITHDRLKKFQAAKQVLHPLANPARRQLPRDLHIVCTHLAETREHVPHWRREQRRRFLNVSRDYSNR